MSDVSNEAVQILVIEDEDDIRNLVVMNLKRAGFDVMSAGNGSDGLSLLRAHRPPVLLLDLMLITLLRVQGHFINQKVLQNLLEFSLQFCMVRLQMFLIWKKG